MLQTDDQSKDKKLSDTVIKQGALIMLNQVKLILF